MGYDRDIYRGLVVQTDIGFFYKRKFKSLERLFKHEDLAIFRLKTNNYKIIEKILVYSFSIFAFFFYFIIFLSWLDMLF